MKTLFIVRHAKSSKDWENIRDTDRPLNEKGYHDAHLIGGKLREKKVITEKFPSLLLISSPAIRALTTALIIAQSIIYSEENIMLKKNLYESTVGDHLEVISKTDNRVQSLMIFGHNPTFSQLFTHLLQKSAEEMPTCALAGISFNISSWKDITASQGQLVIYMYPRLFSNSSED